MPSSALTLATHLVTYPYQWGAPIVEPPAAKQLRVNSLDPTAVTKAWLTMLNLISDDVYFVLMKMPVGTTLFVQDHDAHANFLELRITGAVIDKTTYVELPVEWVDHGGTVVGNNQDILCAFFGPAITTTPPTEPPPTTEPPPLGPDSPPQVPDVSWLTLDELKAHLYITHAWDDAALTQLAIECSTAILLYLHPRGDPAWTTTTVPSDVKAAVKLLAGAYWTDRGDNPQGTAKTVWTDIGVLLARRKDPVLA